MHYQNLQDLRLGEGIPKICVPLTGHGMPALLSELQQALALPADLFEWRMDCFFGDPLAALPTVLDCLGEKPLLCTLRTVGEGGSAALTPEEYERQVSGVLAQGGFALVDIELSCGEERVQRLQSLARRQGIGVVLSKHDFAKTPPAEEIAATLLHMKELGADLPKYAVMPHTPEDVLALLDATLRASRKVGPVITMSMGELGKLSRVSGGVFGSCVTFGAGQNASAPGQSDAEDLRAILEDVQPHARAEQPACTGEGKELVP